MTVGKTVEEIHADLLAEGQDVTTGQVEEKLAELLALGFIQKADLSFADLGNATD